MGNRAGTKISVSLPRAHAEVLDAYAAETHAGNRSAAVAALIETSGLGLDREYQPVTKSRPTSPAQATSAAQ